VSLDGDGFRRKGESQLCVMRGRGHGGVHDHADLAVVLRPWMRVGNLYGCHADQQAGTQQGEHAEQLASIVTGLEPVLFHDGKLNHIVAA
jgi:hypothetical protein